MMTRHTGLVLVTTLLVCAASAEPPQPEFVPIESAPAEDAPAFDGPTLDEQGTLNREPTDLRPPTEATPNQLNLDTPVIPADLEKVRQQFKSPLEGSILGEPNERDFRAAYERLKRDAAQRPSFLPYRSAEDNGTGTPNDDYVPLRSQSVPHLSAPRQPAPPSLSTPGFDAFGIEPTRDHPGSNDLLTITLRLDRQAYHLDRQGEHELADELRLVTQQIRARFREKANAPQQATRAAIPATQWYGHR